MIYALSDFATGMSVGYMGGIIIGSVLYELMIVRKR